MSSFQSLFDSDDEHNHYPSSDDDFQGPPVVVPVIEEVTVCKVCKQRTGKYLNISGKEVGQMDEIMNNVVHVPTHFMTHKKVCKKCALQTSFEDMCVKEEMAESNATRAFNEIRSILFRTGMIREVPEQSKKG